MKLEDRIVDALRDFAALPEAQRDRLIGMFRASFELGLRHADAMPEELAEKLKSIALALGMKFFIGGGAPALAKVFAKVSDDLDARRLIGELGVPKLLGQVGE